MAFVLKKPPPLIAKHEAYPYQVDAVRAVQDLPYAAIFHEQGLGKTKIAADLALLWLCKDIVDTVFVVTKKTLVQNWVDELKAHSYITPQVLSDDRRHNSIALNSPVLIYIMNYEVVSTNLDLIRQFLQICRVGAVLDESQKIKNPSAKLSVCFHDIAEKFVRRIIMTGTPVANRPYDIWSQIKFLDNGEALGTSFDEFKNTLDLPDKSISVPEYGERLAKVRKKIQHFSVRETKATAGIELPEKSILTHWVELAPHQAEIYASYRDTLSYEIRGSGNGLVIDDAEEILKRLLRLVQCAANPVLIDKTYKEIPGKYQALLELFEDLKPRENKIIIWTGYIDNVEWLHQKLGSFAPQKLHGKRPIIERNEAVRQFKEDDECRILLATPGAAKEGLTLTVANHAVFFDRGFSLDDYLQAQDRIHRISQTEECFVHNLIARNTIDEWVDTLLHVKYQAAQLTQGDISVMKFKAEFTEDFSEALKTILSPPAEGGTG